MMTNAKNDPFRLTALLMLLMCCCLISGCATGTRDTAPVPGADESSGIGIGKAEDPPISLPLESYQRPKPPESYARQNIDARLPGAAPAPEFVTAISSFPSATPRRPRGSTSTCSAARSRRSRADGSSGSRPAA